MVKKVSESEVAQLCLTLCDPMDYNLHQASSWDFPGKSTGVGCHFLLQGIVPGVEPRYPALQAETLPSKPPAC